jgi:Helix-turn-helix domain
MSFKSEAELRRIIDTAKDLTPDVPLTGGIKFARIPAAAAGMKMSANDWQVYVAVASHADRWGKAHPSLDRVARIAGMHRNHVSRSIKRLRTLGLLKSWHVRRGSGFANNHYEMIYDVEASREPEGDEASPDAGTPDEAMVPEMGSPHPVAPAMVQGGTSCGVTTGTWDGALTDHLTDHEAMLTKEKKIEGIEEERLQGTSDESTPSVPAVVSVAIGPQNTCRFYVTNSTGYRLCGKLVLLGDTHCAEHQRSTRVAINHSACASGTGDDSIDV